MTEVDGFRNASNHTPSESLFQFAMDRIDTVVMLGVERETFWDDAEAERSAYFVGISRAKRRLFLTVCEYRERPDGAANRWTPARTEHAEFLGYAGPYI